MMDDRDARHRYDRHDTVGGCGCVVLIAVLAVGWCAVWGVAIAWMK